jgi:apolipoprotein N-acyltransferase
MLVGRTAAFYDEGVFYNVIDHVDDSGAVVETYAKQHPVPFGEYVPVPALRRFVSTLDQIPLDMARGDEPLVFEVDGVRIATPICFESAFARDVRGFVRQGAELMVYSTNDSSFERTAAPAQHLAHARMRAAEMRQWGVQAALSGHSAVIDPDGRVLERTDLFERAIVEATVRARPASSLYARTGDLFAWGWIAGSLIALLLYLAMLARGRAGAGAAESDHVDATAPAA